MKTNLFIVIFAFFIFGELFAQNPDTIHSKLLDSGKTWVYQVLKRYPEEYISHNLCYKIGDNTTVNNTTYKILLSSFNGEEFNDIRGLIRETDDKKVFFRKTQFAEEYLLYDFGMQPGDTAYLGTFHEVTVLDSVGENEKGQKLYYLTEASGLNDTWIEGVGSTIGLLRDRLWAKVEKFTCCLLNDENLYHNPDFENCFLEMNPAILDSVSNMLIGKWSWYGSGGGFSDGFGGPEENGYEVTIDIEQDLYSDSLLFWNYVNDTLDTQGKAKIHYWERDISVYETNSIIPFIHDSYFVKPGDSDRMIQFQFLNKDTIRYYNEMCADCVEVYYKRVKGTGIKKLEQANSAIIIYPNPATNSITVSNPLNYKIKQIEIINLSGHIIKQWNITNLGDNILHLESVLQGIYILKIETEIGIETRKLVVQ